MRDLAQKREKSSKINCISWVVDVKNIENYAINPQKRENLVKKWTTLKNKTPRSPSSKIKRERKRDKNSQQTQG